MAKLREYGDLSDSDPRPVRDVIATAPAAFAVPKPPLVELARVSAGWACAGSVARWDAAHWSVRWTCDGAYYGARYSAEYKAREHFERIATPREG